MEKTKRKNKTSRLETVVPTKVTLKQWEMAVREARQFVANYSKTRWKIVDIALRVCDISKGGRKHENSYTLVRFANDIEINEHTLYEWVRCKTNVLDKLPNNVVTKIKNGVYEHKIVTDVLGKVGPKSPKNEVLGWWMEIEGTEPETRKFQKYAKVLNSILYNAQRPLQMNYASNEIIEEIIQKANAVVGLLGKELELRKKFSSEERINTQLKKRKEALTNLTNSTKETEHVIG